MRIFIMRHGESYSNVGGRIMSSTDLPLTDRGVLQAAAARDYLLGRVGGFDAVYSSPLIRAKQTAETIWQNGIKICPDLREMDLGKVEGLTWEERSAKYSDINIEHHLSTAAMPEGESFGDLLHRCDRFIRDELGPLADKRGNVLLVTHGITMRVLINRILGRESHRVDQMNWADNTSFSEIEWDPQTNAKTLLAFNDRTHLINAALGNPHYEKWGLFSDIAYD